MVLIKSPWTAANKYVRRFGSINRTIPSNAVSESTIADLASKPLHPLTLADLVRYLIENPRRNGVLLIANRYGRPPLPLPALYKSANFSLSILPSRLAHRIQQLRNLPFIIVTNPHIAQIHNNYVHSLHTLLPYAEREISTPEEEDSFTEIMAGLVQTHSNTIPTLARGFLESRKYINPDYVTKFLDDHLRARIGTRLIAEQHIALHYSSKSQEGISPEANSSFVGIIDTALRPASVIEQCENFVSEICELNYGVRPSVTINGDPETRIAHIPVHLEYVVTELLKNSFRAIIENGAEREPIEVTIAPSPADTPAQMKSKITIEDQGEADAASASIRTSESATPGVTIRIRDRGGGVSPDNCANLWTYGFTTFNDKEAKDAKSTSGQTADALNVISGASTGGGSIAGLGYGLPLGRAYAEYFGGGIALQSLWGWGTDVYLSLRGVGSLD